MRLLGKITRGTPVFNPKTLYAFCAKNEGKAIEIKVIQTDRSLSQLAMYRAWLSQVAEQTGNDEEALHEYLLEGLAPRVVTTITGKSGNKYQKTLMKRTSGGHALSMNKAEMSEYMEKAAITTGYPLPTKEELEAMGYISNV